MTATSSSPSSRGARRDPTLWILTAMLGAGVALAAWRGGWPWVWEGARRGLSALTGVLPLLLVAFWLSGLVQVLASPAWITQHLGRDAGWWGVMLAAVFGGMLPGGPYVYYPLAAVLLRNGAGVGAVMAFVTAKNYWSFTRLPVEIALWGWRLTAIRFVLTLPLPLLLGWGAEALFGRHVEMLRASQPEEGRG